MAKYTMKLVPYHEHAASISQKRLDAYLMMRGIVRREARRLLAALDRGVEVEPGAHKIFVAEERKGTIVRRKLRVT